ncbi:histidine kinase dimerization/phosphoacceptor domain-containing protein [Streptomyces thinghirensis]|nr:histidine kinase dimerization/phosphoacceptor domain-containing protein [Streptomyces thinghirensis]
MGLSGAAPRAKRRRLIEELHRHPPTWPTPQAAGVLEERQRSPARSIDTLAQGLSSIQLLLRAAERALPDRPAPAITYVGQARQAAVDNLAEASTVRRRPSRRRPWTARPSPTRWTGSVPPPVTGIARRPARSPAGPRPLPTAQRVALCASPSPRWPTRWGTPAPMAPR